jgi:hypothetical protein
MATQAAYVAFWNWFGGLIQRLHKTRWLMGLWNAGLIYGFSAFDELRAILSVLQFRFVALISNLDGHSTKKLARLLCDFLSRRPAARWRSLCARQPLLRRLRSRRAWTVCRTLSAASLVWLG